MRDKTRQVRKTGEEATSERKQVRGREQVRKRTPVYTLSLTLHSLPNSLHPSPEPMPIHTIPPLDTTHMPPSTPVHSPRPKTPRQLPWNDIRKRRSEVQGKGTIIYLHCGLEYSFLYNEGKCADLCLSTFTFVFCCHSASLGPSNTLMALCPKLTSVVKLSEPTSLVSFTASVSSLKNSLVIPLPLSCLCFLCLFFNSTSFSSTVRRHCSKDTYLERWCTG